MPKTAVCLKVAKKQGEVAIALAFKLGLMDKALVINREGEWLFVPLLREPDSKESEAFAAELKPFELASG